MEYQWLQLESYTASPVAEVVGWQVLDGLKSTPQGLRIPADGDAIVNLTRGLRCQVVDDQSSLGKSTSLFVGYGTALTNETWYSDIIRLELRCSF